MEAPTMPTETEAAPAPLVDARGRVRRLTAKEQSERAARLRALFDRIEAQPSTPEEEATYREILRGIDEGRPERKLFEGMY